MDALVVALEDLDPTQLAVGGGKAVNVGELIRAGLPVPPGVCVTTDAYAQAARALDIDDTIDELERADAEHLPEVAAALRARFEQAPVPEQIAHAIASAVAELGASQALAVRSSATAEDLPFAS